MIRIIEEPKEMQSAGIEHCYFCKVKSTTWAKLNLHVCVCKNCSSDYDESDLPVNKITQKQAKNKAIQFLQTFTRSDFTDMKMYAKMKAYKSQLKNGKLGAKSFETILTYLGYEKTEIWTLKKPSDKLIDILI